jgi:hypothetical protein
MRAPVEHDVHVLKECNRQRESRLAQYLAITRSRAFISKRGASPRKRQSQQPNRLSASKKPSEMFDGSAVF